MTSLLAPWPAGARFVHRIGQQTAQAARQRIADRLEVLRATGADRAALTAFLARCEQAGQVVDE